MRWNLPLLSAMLLAISSAAHAQSIFGMARELRLSGALLDVRRAAVGPDGHALPEASGTLSGGEAVLRFGGLGFRGQLLSGTLGAGDAPPGGDFKLRSVSLEVGPRAFAVEGGLGDRTATPGDTTETISLVHVGIRSEIALSGNAVLVTLSASRAFRGTVSTLSTMEAVGKVAEVSVLLQPSYRVPLFIQLGYRYDTFDDSLSPAGIVEETSGLWLAAGLRRAR